MRCLRGLGTYYLLFTKQVSEVCDYTEWIEILGEEVEMKEVAERMTKSDKILYGWLRWL